MALVASRAVLDVGQPIAASGREPSERGQHEHQSAAIFIDTPAAGDRGRGFWEQANGWVSFGGNLQSERRAAAAL